MSSDVRERAREALRTEIAEVIYDLFAERGFDGVTVEEAAAHAGISRATFFRYFRSKEDVVIAAVRAARFDLAAAIRRLSPIEGESAWELLRRALVEATDGAPQSPERAQARIRMIAANPALRGRLMENQFAREESVTVELAARIADPDDARALAVAALAVTDLAWRQWAFGPPRELGSVLQDLFDSLAAGGDATRG